MRRILSGFIFAFTMLLAISSWARPCVTIKLVSLQGIVEARQAGQNNWQRAKLDEAFCIGDSIRTGSKARAALVIASDNTYVRLDQLTTLTLAPEAGDNGIFAELARGIAYFLTRTPRSLKVQTPFVNAAVRGTEFVVRADSSQASVTVLEGSVLASNANGQLPLASGESAIAAGGQAPKARLDIAPRDTVMWALYYPPLFDSRVLKLDTPWIEPLRQSAAAYLAGDIATAFEQIRAVPESVSDARFLNYRAGLLLSVGRLDEAQADIQRSLATSNGNAHALALQSVIALAQNNRNEALQLARQAASADAESTPALSALSYAQQARFDINAARASIETALQHDRENVLLWARLSELWLALGDMPNALAAADRAVTLNPNVARTQSVLGFVELTRANAKSARAAFEKAITFDSADPLPRLGLGLALIRMGELEAGRREIEIAVTLDPNNALIRSYLGKAYYEEKRGALAATQLDMAKALDPNDPTPWFYDAIRKQSENRPVEALRDLQKSIALNDNRAVYRSRLLLDQDLAARGASLARIYSDLGFEQLALREATKSLSVDPADHSAHRFLADAYSGMRRHEIARASEALQSQLLQPLNLNPVPLQLSETNTNILSGAGPTAAGFNEFNPLFERNRFALRAAGVVGSNGTRGDELIHSGLQDNVSYSLGQFHYETDGFRPNNGLKLDIYNAFVQTAITPQSNLQFEWRSRRQENGDLAMQFDATNFSSALHEETKEKTVRLGYRFTPSPKAGLILSAIRRETDSARQDARTIFAAAPFPPFAPIVRSESQYANDVGSSVEVQGYWRAYGQHHVFGASYVSSELVNSPGLLISSGSRILASSTSESMAKLHDFNAYAYSHLNVGPAMTVTVGLSRDKLKFDSFEADQLNPKLGLAWAASSNTLVRFAAFRVLKRPPLANLTIEPTQVAGFNQFYDDRTGTDSKRYGIAVDQTLTSKLSGGLELSRRELDVPLLGLGGVLTRVERQEERAHRAYLYWTPHTALAATAEYHFEEFNRQSGDFASAAVPRRLVTHRLPISVGYFSPNGLFARLTATGFRQQIEWQRTPTRTETDNDRFWITDFTLGYRLPKRRGVASIEVRNLFKEAFKFHDLDFQSGLPMTPVIQPDRVIFLKLALAWD